MPSMREHTFIAGFSSKEKAKKASSGEKDKEICAIRLEMTMNVRMVGYYRKRVEWYTERIKS